MTQARAMEIIMRWLGKKMAGNVERIPNNRMSPSITAFQKEKRERSKDKIKIFVSLFRMNMWMFF